nr:serine/arginine repetitive matrix protein 2-like [Ipomoea batatas]
MVPAKESKLNWSADQVGGWVAQDILWLAHTTTNHFYLAKDVEPLKKAVAHRDARIKDLKKRAFLRYLANEDLVWSFGKWTFTTGQRAMQQEVLLALAEYLNDDDLANILGILPDEVAEPSPLPYTEPPAADVVAPPAKPKGRKSIR